VRPSRSRSRTRRAWRPARVFVVFACVFVVFACVFVVFACVFVVFVRVNRMGWRHEEADVCGWRCGNERNDQRAQETIVTLKR
jgi:ABC-type Fe3+ transport system permease subunit